MFSITQDIYNLTTVASFIGLCTVGNFKKIFSVLGRKSIEEC